MVLALLVCTAAWAVLSIVLGVVLAAVIGHADRRERAEVARRAAAARASEPAAVSVSGTRWQSGWGARLDITAHTDQARPRVAPAASTVNLCQG